MKLLLVSLAVVILFLLIKRLCEIMGEEIGKDFKKAGFSKEQINSIIEEI